MTIRHMATESSVLPVETSMRVTTTKTIERGVGYTLGQMVTNLKDIGWKGKWSEEGKKSWRMETYTSETGNRIKQTEEASKLSLAEIVMKGNTWTISVMATGRTSGAMEIRLKAHG